jgi:hypothetical protein
MRSIRRPFLAMIALECRPFDRDSLRVMKFTLILILLNGHGMEACSPNLAHITSHKSQSQQFSFLWN